MPPVKPGDKDRKEEHLETFDSDSCPTCKPRRHLLHLLLFEPPPAEAAGLPHEDKTVAGRPRLRFSMMSSRAVASSCASVTRGSTCQGARGLKFGTDELQPVPEWQGLIWLQPELGCCRDADPFDTIHQDHRDDWTVPASATSCSYRGSDKIQDSRARSEVRWTCHPRSDTLTPHRPCGIQICSSVTLCWQSSRNVRIPHR